MLLLAIAADAEDTTATISCRIRSRRQAGPWLLLPPLLVLLLVLLLLVPLAALSLTLATAGIRAVGSSGGAPAVPSRGRLGGLLLFAAVAVLLGILPLLLALAAAAAASTICAKLDGGRHIRRRDSPACPLLLLLLPMLFIILLERRHCLCTCAGSAGSGVLRLLRCAAHVCEEGAAVAAEGRGHLGVGCRQLRQGTHVDVIAVVDAAAVAATAAGAEAWTSRRRQLP